MVALREKSISESLYYPLHDANFNVLGLADAGGGLVERYEYTPYGQRTVYKSSGSDDPLCMSAIMESQRVKVDGVDQPYGLCDVGHQGLFHDKEFGLIYNRERYLNPILARYLSPDRLRYVDGMNYFEYLRSRPVGGLDPMGQEWTILRSEFFERAEAVAGENDTIRSLAKAIQLDPHEFPAWIRESSDPFRDSDRIRTTEGELDIYGIAALGIYSGGVVNPLDVTICPGEGVSVPNTAVIVHGDKSTWLLANIASLGLAQSVYSKIYNERHHEMESWFSRKNYNIVNIKGYDAAFVRGQLQRRSSNIAAFGFIGHGIPGTSYFPMLDDDSTLTVLDIEKSINHKLSWIILYACSGGAKNNEGVPLWSLRLAPGGQLWANDYDYWPGNTSVNDLDAYHAPQ